MPPKGILFLCSLFVLGDYFVASSPLYPPGPGSHAYSQDADDEYGFANYEAILDSVRNKEWTYEDEAEALSLLRRLNHQTHVAKRADAANVANAANDVNLNNNNNADLRRRSGGSGQNLNALWKTRVQRSDSRIPELSALWKTRV